MLRVYVDTCIISGIAKRDLTEGESTALLKILQLRKQGTLEVVTSEQAAVEIARIPPAHRRPHELVLSLLAEVPIVQTHRTDSGLLLMGVGGGRREDPIFTLLKTTLPDIDDAHHIFQAAKNGAQYFLTVDRKTIINRSESIQEAVNVIPLAPSELLDILGDG